MTPNGPYPLITVGITCFNAEESIEVAISSAQGQSWPNIEIVVVDDASHDHSVDRIRSLAKRDTRIRLVRHKKNLGCAAARNTILSNSRGEFLAYFDDDDVSQSDRLERQYERVIQFENNNRSGSRIVCYSSRQVTNGKDAKMDDPIVAGVGWEGPAVTGDDIANLLLLGYADPRKRYGELGTCTIFARTSTFQSVGGFDPEFRRCAEWDWAIRVGESGARFISVPEVLVTQRITATEDKSGKIPLTYALRLRKKHRGKFHGVREAWYSEAMARVKYLYARGSRVRRRMWLAIALVLCPQHTLAHRRFYRG